MKQALHILRKDLRHLWPFIAAMLVSVAATALLYPRSWGEFGGYPNRFLGMALRPDLVIVLVPLVAWLLVTRILQEEPLVGDRHFWLTRPYQWQQLLLARVLFYLLVIVAPVAVMQMVLVHRAGFAVFAAFPALVLNAFTLSLFLLPFALIAVITRTFVQAFFTLIGLCIYIAICAGLNSFFNAGFNPGPDGPLFTVFLILVPMGIIVVQFASRRVWWSRTAFGILLLLVGATAVAPMGSITVPMSYPELREPEVRLHFDADSSRKLENLEVDPKRDEVPVRLPLESDGLVLNHQYSVAAASIALRGANGAYWNSGWKEQGWTLQPGRSVETAEVMMPHAAYEQLKNTPVHAEIQLAVRETVLGGVTKTILKDGWNDLPAIGRCRAHSNRFLGSQLECRTAVWEPYTAEVGVQYFTAPCGTSKSQPSVAGYMQAFGETTRVLPMSLPGVWVRQLSPTNGFILKDQPVRYVCPGSQITLRRILDGQQMRVSTKADGIRLAEYAGYVASKDDADD